jgi:hypothetical protein
MATSYEVSEDGLVYTVKIMDNVPWVKYDPTKDEVVKCRTVKARTPGHRRGFQVRSYALAQRLIRRILHYIAYLKGAAEQQRSGR